MAPSVSRSPPRHLRTSGRPMGPATPYIQTQFSRTNCFGFVWFLLGLRLVSCCCSDFSGEIIRVFGFVPFRTCPLLAEVFVVLSLFLWLFGCARRRRLLSFFLFQALGKPKPLLGFGFPLVFSSSRTSTTPSTRTLCSASLARSSPARSAFFFFLAARVGVFWVWFLLSCLSVCLSVCRCMQGDP